MWHIIGSTGFIGKNLLRRLPYETDYLCYARNPISGEIPIDIAQPGSFFKSMSTINAGDFVVLLAAVSSPDICRDHYGEAYAVNVAGTKAFIEECLRRDARVLFFSSDVVVGGTDHAHDETMPVHPAGNYGTMKYEVERAFAGDPRFKVFRLSYVFSKEDKFMRYLQTCAENGETADVFQALYRNVVYLNDVLDAVIALGGSFGNWENSVFHLSGPELLCRADMTECFKRFVAPALRYTTSIPKPHFFEARPNCIETKSLYFSRLIGHEPLSLSYAVQLEFLEKKE